MTPGSAPTPVRPILFIVLGAAVVIWFIVQRNSRVPHPTPAASQNSLANNVTAEPPKASEEQIERYPMLDCPDAVPPEQEFPIQVSLTEQQQGEAAKILGGKSTSDG